MKSEEVQPKAKVIFAGAGPGDPELITVRAAKYLLLADVVLVDRLVSPVIIHSYLKPGVTVVFVGKQAGKSGSIPQPRINELLLQYALPGKLVVRLKGGDVSVFSNILDELETLTANNISFEIIPGVTAGLGAAAYAGIPLTARGYSTAVRFLTYYKEEVITGEVWKELAQTTDTLVFYMASKQLEHLIDHLLSAGISADKPLAVIEQATTAFQRISFNKVGGIMETLQDKELMSPALLIIGDVVSLHKKFAWFTTIETELNYFDPVTDPMKANEVGTGESKKSEHAAGF
ncbi:uroporphyrinogen-III C-methyltransferase [Pollutibacter soli]|uniref:uroporphyrinogen-III C-methyltransferase n=1 Tax=Pollutibacter soli TaxID=3034157 RepID=UPI0030133D65